jgi:ABC-2 type transport system permease protein
VIDRLGLRRYFVLLALVMLVAMVALLALPVILVEETEKKTLDALALIISYADVVAGKTLVGATYIAVATALLLGLTRLSPADPLLFVLAMVVFSITVVGFGLLLASLFHNANQLNTWSGLFVAPFVIPIFLVAAGLPKAVTTVLSLLPAPRATELFVNGLSGQAIYSNVWLSLLILLAWAAAVYTLLLWRLSHRAE